MRNKYPGICYQCGKRVEVGAGHFQRFQGGWRTHHADCAIKNREIRQAKKAKSNPQKEE